MLQAARTQYTPITLELTVMTIKLAPLPLPPTANPEKLSEFGRVVSDVNPAKLSESEFREIENLLYKVSIYPPVRSGTHYLIRAAQCTFV